MRSCFGEKENISQIFEVYQQIKYTYNIQHTNLELYSHIIITLSKFMAQNHYVKSNGSFQSQLNDIEQQIVEETAIETDLKAISIYKFQVSGKNPKYKDEEKGIIYKIFSIQQYQFYEFIKTITVDNDGYALTKFIPQYYGVKNQKQMIFSAQKVDKQHSKQSIDPPSDRQKWIDHITLRSKFQNQKELLFIGLKDLTHHFHTPNIIDIKLGTKKQKKSNSKFVKTTTNSHKFRINGLINEMKSNQTYEECFMSKYYGQSIELQEMESHVAFFFFDGQIINQTLLSKVIAQLKELILSLKKFKNIKFVSSSLFLAYDSRNSSQYSMKLIDFDKYKQNFNEQDNNILEGLINFHFFLIKILENIPKNTDILRQRRLRYFQTKNTVVPQHKIDQFK